MKKACNDKPLEICEKVRNAYKGWVFGSSAHPLDKQNLWFPGGFPSWTKEFNWIPEQIPEYAPDIDLYQKKGKKKKNQKSAKIRDDKKNEME